MGATASYTLEDQARMTRAVNYFGWQHSLVMPQLGRRVIEIGCGIGNFTRLLLDREAIVAIDAEPACIERLRERFPDQANLRAFACDVRSAQFAELQSFQADCCVCLNVLEHVEDDLGALRNMASVLAPGGVAIFLIPAFQALYGPIDERLGHFRRYTKASFAELAWAAGFRVKACHYLNAVGFFGWWTNAHILKREAQSESQIEFFDRYVVPVTSKIENWVHPPFGQSLFVVLEKSEQSL